MERRGKGAGPTRSTKRGRAGSCSEDVQAAAVGAEKHVADHAQVAAVPGVRNDGAVLDRQQGRAGRRRLVRQLEHHQVAGREGFGVDGVDVGQVKGRRAKVAGQHARREPRTGHLGHDLPPVVERRRLGRRRGRGRRSGILPRRFGRRRRRGGGRRTRPGPQERQADRAQEQDREDRRRRVRPAPGSDGAAAQGGLLHGLNRLDDGLGGGKSLLRLLSQQAQDQPIQGRRQVGARLARRPRVVGGDGHEDGDRVRPRERRIAGGHAVEDAAEAEQVAARVHRGAAGLLRRHVRRRADDGPFLRQRGVGRRTRQAEIEDLDAASGRRRSRLAFQPDVGGLDVAVDQAAGVGRGQAEGDLPADTADFIDRQNPFAPEPVLQRLAGQQRHGEVGDAAVLADFVDGNDVVVQEGGRRPALAQEAAASGVAGGQAGPHGLEGDRPAEGGVLGVVHDAHAARSEDFEDAIRSQAAQLAGRLRGGQEVVQLAPRVGGAVGRRQGFGRPRRLVVVVRRPRRAATAKRRHQLVQRLALRPAVGAGADRVEQPVVGPERLGVALAPLARFQVLVEGVAVRRGDASQQELLQRLARRGRGSWADTFPSLGAASGSRPIASLKNMRERRRTLPGAPAVNQSSSPSSSWRSRAVTRDRAA